MKKFLLGLALFSSLCFAGTPDQWRQSGIPAANSAANISPTTNAAAIDVIFGPSAAANKGMVIQAKSSQSANLVELQDSTGATLTAFGAASSANFLSMSQGASAAVSGANTGRLIYNATAQAWQISANGGAYASITTGAATADTYIKSPVRVASTINATLGTAYENGDTVDGVVLATGNRILINSQTTLAENGIYTVNASGAPTRASDSDAASEVVPGSMVSVTAGTANINRTFMLRTNENPTVLGTTSLMWSPMNASSANDNVAYGFRAGLTNSGGSQNTYFGYQAGVLATGTQAVIIGSNAGTNSSSTNVYIGVNAGTEGTGAGNVVIGTNAYNTGNNGAAAFVIIGHEAGQDIMQPSNTFIGYRAGRNATNTTETVALGSLSVSDGVATGTSNVWVGHRSGLSATSAASNTVVGADAADGMTTGLRNVAVGASSLGLATATNLDDNVSIGYFAGDGLDTGDRNVLIGTNVGGAATSAAMSDTVMVGYQAGLVNTANQNVFIGSGAGDANTSGTGQTLVGYNAGGAVTGNANTLIGNSAGSVITNGVQNTIIGRNAGSGAGSTAMSDTVMLGYQAGLVNTSDWNVFIGSKAGQANTSGARNHFVGYEAGLLVSTSPDNTIMGMNAGDGITTGTGQNAIFGSSAATANSNTMARVSAFGYGAGQANLGDGNSYFGYLAGSSSTSPIGQAMFGFQAGQSLTTADNTIFGYGAGDTFTTGTRNVLMGTDAAGNNGASAMSDTVIIGYQAGLINSGDQNVIIGSTAGNAATTGTLNTIIGYNADIAATDTRATAIGGNTISITDSTALGNGSDASFTSGIFVSGSSSTPMDNVYFGKGRVNASATEFTLNGTGGSGTNNAGAALQLAGGKGTGTAEPGLVVLKYPLKTTTGTTLQALSTQSFPISTTIFTANTTSITATASVVNTTETTLLGTPTAGSVSLEGGLLRVGRVIRVRARGQYLTSGTPVTQRYQFKWGSVALFDSGAITPVASVSNSIWQIDQDITIRTIGASGTARIVGFMHCQGTTTTDIKTISLITSSTFDTTTTANLNFTVTFGGNTAGNAITCDTFTCEILN